MVKQYLPTSLDDALEYINEYNSTVISGGTDLMVQKRNWAETPPKFDKHIVYIFNLGELKFVKKTENNLLIGATTPIEDVLDHSDTPSLLKEAIGIMASPALRNLATIAGNIGNASPAGDTLPILYAYDALVVIESIDNTKIVPISEVILGPRKTILKSNEIITDIVIPLTHFDKTSFVKVGGRKADAISKVSFTGAVKIENDTVTDLRICFGAVGPTIVRNKEIENKYKDITIEQLKGSIDQLIGEYSEIIKPIDDVRSNKEYRKKVALNLLQDFIQNL